MFIKIFNFIIFLSLLFFLSNVAFAYQTDFSFTDAKIVKEDKKLTTYQKPNGTIIFKYSDKSVAILKNGDKITKFLNGKKEILLKNKTIIYINNDGSSKIKYPNGKIKNHSYDGLTPYGTKVKKEFLILKNKENVVTIIYSSKMSDNNMSKPMKNFFYELRVQTNNWLNSENLDNCKIKIVISNCRFGKTGFCKRKKRKNISITAYQNKNKISKVFIKSKSILNNKNHISLSKKIIKLLLNNKIRKTDDK